MASSINELGLSDMGIKSDLLGMRYQANFAELQNGSVHREPLSCI
jgi:hypothetical protein